jgi:hypothetical protein
VLLHWAAFKVYVALRRNQCHNATALGSHSVLGTCSRGHARWRLKLALRLPIVMRLSGAYSPGVFDRRSDHRLGVELVRVRPD